MSGELHGNLHWNHPKQGGISGESAGENHAQVVPNHDKLYSGAMTWKIGSSLSLTNTKLCKTTRSQSTRLKNKVIEHLKE